LPGGITLVPKTNKGKKKLQTVGLEGPHNKTGKTSTTQAGGGEVGGHQDGHRRLKKGGKYLAQKKKKKGRTHFPYNSLIVGKKAERNRGGKGENAIEDKKGSQRGRSWFYRRVA